MKTAKLPLYYIGMLLMALPFFFTSCSSDDDGFTPWLEEVIPQVR